MFCQIVARVFPPRNHNCRLVKQDLEWIQKRSQIVEFIDFRETYVVMHCRLVRVPKSRPGRDITAKFRENKFR